MEYTQKEPVAEEESQPEMNVFPDDVPATRRRIPAGIPVVIALLFAMIDIGPVVATKPNCTTPIGKVRDIVRSSTQTVFCVMSDAPYNPTQRTQMKAQLENVASDCEFLVHLGDIKSGQTPCIEYIYQDTRSMLLRSRAPAFSVIGDNEWNDCPTAQISDAWTFWNRHLLGIVDSWNHGFNIERLQNRTENLYFVYKRTLFIMLNLVGGKVIAGADKRQKELAKFTIDVLSKNVPIEASGVVIMAHAHPYSQHNTYFQPVFQFIAGNIPNIPFLYLHGDGHAWEYDLQFGKNFSNMLRMQMVGGTREKPLKMIVDPFTENSNLTNAFKYTRYY